MLFKFNFLVVLCQEKNVFVDCMWGLLFYNNLGNKRILL